MFASFPELIAGYHVFLRFSMPRHPPYTLSSLTTFIDHRLLRPSFASPGSQAPASTCVLAETAGGRAGNGTYDRYCNRSPKKMLDRFLPTVQNVPDAETLFRPDGKTKTKRAGIAEVYTYIETLNLNLLLSKSPPRDPSIPQLSPQSGKHHKTARQTRVSLSPQG